MVVVVVVVVVLIIPEVVVQEIVTVILIARIKNDSTRSYAGRLKESFYWCRVGADKAVLA